MGDHSPREMYPSLFPSVEFRSLKLQNKIENCSRWQMMARDGQRLLAVEILKINAKGNEKSFEFANFNYMHF